MSQFEELEPDEMDRAELSRERFLASHRAIAVCAREFGRLAEELADRASVLCSELSIAEPAEMRQTPGRCIVQMGPIAVTTAWLRGPLDSLADGRLMAIAWHGTIVRRGFRERPERNDAPRATQTAVSVWEDTYTASAEDEASWRWKSEVDAARYASTELAALLMDQARAAFQQRKTA